MNQIWSTTCLVWCCLWHVRIPHWLIKISNNEYNCSSTYYWKKKTRRFTHDIHMTVIWHPHTNASGKSVTFAFSNCPLGPYRSKSKITWVRKEPLFSRPALYDYGYIPDVLGFSLKMLSRLSHPASRNTISW